MRPRDTRTPEQLVARVQHTADLGIKNDALAALEQLVAKRPRDAQLWNMFAQALIAAGDYRKALHAAREAIAHNPDDPAWGYINAGIASRELGNLVEAGRFFKKAVARATYDPLAHYQYAKTSHAAGETYAAAQAYVEAIAYAAKDRDDITVLAIAGLGDLTATHPSLSAHLHALMDAARAISERRWASARLHLEHVIAHATDAVTRDAACIMLSLSWRNRTRAPNERPM